MKIGILYICTGKYDVFWPEFYQTCQKYFCTDAQKEYFVFTNSEEIKSTNEINVLYQDDFGWPFNTLYRYHMFLRAKTLLAKCDYIVFFNSNCMFNTFITPDEFFGINKSIVACLHPGFYDKPSDTYTYEKRSNSQACVSVARSYYIGAINGGSSAEFISYIEKMKNMIDNDLSSGIMAAWHDESYWNACLNNEYETINTKLQVLSPAYLYPEGFDLPFDVKIILRDKNKYFNVDSVKSISRNLTLKNKIGKLIRKYL